MQEMADWKWFTEKFDHHEMLMHAIKNPIVQKTTEYQRVGIMNLHYSGKMLVLDGDPQSFQIDEFIYHEALVHPAMLLCNNPKDVFILGGGEGATLREVLKYKDVESAVMVDIDRELVNLCAKHLPEWSCGAFEDPRTEMIFTDGRKWIENTGRKFDVIIHDLTVPRPDSPSRKLFSKEFFQLLKSRLKPGGILAIQASKADFVRMELFCVLKNTLESVFPSVIPYSTFIPSFYLEWGFILSSENQNILQPNHEEIDKRIRDRISGNLRFFDGTTLNSLISFPLCSRKVMDKTKGIITDERFIVENIDQCMKPELIPA